MRYRSAFDIIGPPMIGPSSSHTAGANRIGQLTRQILGRTPEHVVITLYGSFAETYQGHGTDRALLAGLMGMKTDDERIRDAIELAQQLNMHFQFKQQQMEGIHPNTVRIEATAQDEHVNLVGISLGGGSIEIIEFDGYNIRISGNYPTLIVKHIDQIGVVKVIGKKLKKYHLNVVHMEIDRKQKNGEAIAVIELDHPVPDSLLHELSETEPIFSVKKLEGV